MTSSMMSTPLGMLLLFYICLSVPGLVSSQSTACDSGWFGTGCMYKCQCLGNTCPVNDQCSSCQTGYYGPACQYVDISQVSMLPSVQPSLTDNNDATCLPANSNLVSLDVTWNTAYPFTWMRITFQNPNSVNMINAFAVTFNSTQVSCSNLRIAAVNNQTLDIHCEQIGLVSQVRLTGNAVNSLCSVYVSGGRNVALRQNTTQSSTYATYSSDKAVDGNTDPRFSITNTCTATNPETNPNWFVRFSLLEAVNRYVLYNRDTNQERLYGFNLKSMTAANITVYNYIDTTTTNQIMYTLVTTTATVSTLTIQLNGTDRLLTVCEVEIYGDTDCVPGTFGRNCERTCNCANSSDPCFVSTGGCPSGCAAGYYGESCLQNSSAVCPIGTYGIGCTSTCSQNCAADNSGRSVCDAANGTCLLGCKDGYMSPMCTQACDSGWFGKGCMYKCQCLGNVCPTNGQCSGCQPNWFGPACQYADLTQASSLPSTQPSLTDNNDTTCLSASNLMSLDVIWSMPYAFTWMRITVQNPALLNTFTVVYNSTRVACSTLRNATVNNQTLDIHCEQIGLVSQVTLMGSGVSSLCSIYVSGGRDVALRQSTAQSTTYATYGPEKAVDGNSNSNFDTGNSCSSTNGETTPNWSVRFSLPEAVNRYVLYNRNLLQERLYGFNLTSLNAANVLVYNYIDTSTTSQNVYTITTTTVSVSNLYIQLNGADKVLTLCEVEIYGDTDCVPGNYGRNCDQRCNCANSSDPCFVSTGGCPSGCAAGYSGESCTQVCPSGTYGIGCASTCSPNCAADGSGTSVCDAANGTCLLGCKDGYMSPMCTQVCPSGTYGIGCASTCSPNCAADSSGTSVCDAANGTCLLGCKDGYMSPMCTQACDSGWFGKGCMYKCQCLGNVCPTNGQCSGCQPNWFGPACQYADLTQASSLPSTQPSLTDNNDTTCLSASNLMSLDVIWSMPYAFTWMRITVQNPALLNTFTVVYNSTRVACITLRNATVNNQTLDIHCEQIGLVSQVTLMGSGVSSLCSIYVSGGRDVALRQSTTQSTTYATYGPEKAVDGNSNSNFDTGNSCSSTNGETTPNWSVRFSLPEAVNRYVLYNRNLLQERLYGFNLTSLNAANVLVYNYIDTSTTSQNVYTITTTTVSVSNLYIQLNGADKVLTLCEVEIYGDTDCVPGNYGRNCDQRCNCANSSDPCFVSTGGCPSGCAAGYSGESCTQVCPSGTYGIGCASTCSPNCAADSSGTSVCDAANGTCLLGCKDGYMSPMCTQVCPPGTYGKNCTLKCSQSCKNDTSGIPICDKANGTCLNGTCDNGWFGTDCKYKCRCSGNVCPTADGQCSSCMSGWFGPACQYVNLAQVSDLPFMQPLLTDNNDTTCLPMNSTMTSVNITWSMPYTFTWMRITVQNPALLSNIAVRFNSTQVACSTLKNATVNSQTLDIHCHQIGLVTQVTLMGSGVSSLCSVYISGGRDVALRQNTTQSSTYATYGSDKAVDGNTDPQFSITNTCTATNLETNPSWSVRFSIPKAVNRYVLYNRDTNPERLVNFNFTSLNSTNAVVYNYMDASTTPLSVYTIVTTTATVSTVTIQLSGTNKLLTICEFEIYGDSACAVGMYGRNCEQRCNCANNNDPCFVSTGGCPSGCAPGYLGESCTQICNPGKYGAQCGLSCSQNCMGSGTACSNTDGTCLQGCKTGYKPPTCQELNAGNSYKSSFGAIVRAVVGAVATLVIAMKF